jgi:small nuclear ribonucleoprotein (snRNP)-like protein
MTSIITADIANSRNRTPEIWLPMLKEVLNSYGTEPSTWEIYRGDSFQLEVKPKEALIAALLIRSTIKLIKGLDIRIAIGIGSKSYESNKITESNGSAFVNSGLCFEQLKKNNMAIKSPVEEFDIQMNLLLDLAQLTMNGWTSKSSEVIKTAIQNPTFTQKELANKLNKAQSTINASLKQSGYEELMKVVDYYKIKLKAYGII